MWVGAGCLRTGRLTTALSRAGSSGSPTRSRSPLCPGLLSLGGGKNAVSVCLVWPCPGWVWPCPRLAGLWLGARQCWHVQRDCACVLCWWPCGHSGKTWKADRASRTQWPLGNHGGEEVTTWFSCLPDPLPRGSLGGLGVRLPRSPTLTRAGSLAVPALGFSREACHPPWPHGARCLQRALSCQTAPWTWSGVRFSLLPCVFS